MLKNRNFAINIVFIIVQVSTFAEWVDIPQFSDNDKVYRLPFINYDRGEKYFGPVRENENPHVHGNVSFMNENFRRRSNQPYGIVRTTERIVNDVRTYETVTTKKHVQSFKNGKRRVTKISQSNDDGDHDDNDEDDPEDVSVSDEEEIVTATINKNDKILVNGDRLYQAISDSDDPLRRETIVPEIEKNDWRTNFLAYLPIELFKKVQAILESQSSSVEGKMNFLKRFENSLLTEIEKRLIPAINPVRQKRGTRVDRGWDDNDKSLGFPSLEGALMAIAFLTFAVYLVQLVMMLFRNLGKGASGTGTATLLFNRNKRAVDELNENTVRILGYLDRFEKNKKVNK